MAVRYDKELNKIISRTVKNYNRRIAKLNSLDRSLKIKKVTVKELKNSATNRRDLKYELSKLDMVRQPEDLEKVVKRDLRRAKLILNAEIRKVKAQEGTPRFTPIKSQRLRNLEMRRASLDINLDKLKPKERLKAEKRIQNEIYGDQERLRKFYDNFFNMLFSNVYYSGFGNDEWQRITNELSKLTPDQLLQAYNENPLIRGLIEDYHIYQSVSDTRQGFVEQTMYNTLNALYSNIGEIVKEYR